jgi:hypothetical protein
MEEQLEGTRRSSRSTTLQRASSTHRRIRRIGLGAQGKGSLGGNGHCYWSLRSCLLFSILIFDYPQALVYMEYVLPCFVCGMQRWHGGSSAYAWELSSNAGSLGTVWCILCM